MNTLLYSCLIITRRSSKIDAVDAGIKDVHEGFYRVTFPTRTEINTSDVPTLAPLTIKVAHLFSVTFGKILHGPVHYNQNAVVGQCIENFLFSLFFTLHGSSQTSLGFAVGL